MNYNWNWGVYFQQTPDGDAFYWQWIAYGLVWTLAVSALAWIIAMSVGALIGTIRTTEKRALVRFGNGWVELFRNIPLLVQMFLWYFVIPEFIPPLKRWMIETEPAYAQFLAAVLCLGLFTSARIAEQVRAGIQSLSRGQRNAGLAVGLTQVQVYRYVLLPMAFRIVIPPLTSETMNLIRSHAWRICSDCAVSTTSDDVRPKCSHRAAGPTFSATAVVKAMTSCCVVCSISSMRATSKAAFARSSFAASGGTIPASAIASAAASSTASHVS